MKMRKHRKRMHNYAGWFRPTSVVSHNGRKLALYIWGVNWRWPA